MFGLYTASAKYLLAEQRVLGTAHAKLEASQNARAKHFVDSIPSFPRDALDCANAQAEVETETIAFAEAQRTTMAVAIATHMQGSELPSSTITSKMQKHNSMRNYFPESKWACVMSRKLFGTIIWNKS
jgi:hypothetical protein